METTRGAPDRVSHTASPVSSPCPESAHGRSLSASAAPRAQTNTRPSADPAADMRLVTAFLRAVEEETAASARFLLAEGDCAVVDNLRMAHGREAYADLGRALWQVWVWTNTSIAVPELAGPNRGWVRHPSTARGVVGECSS